jgi:formylglycine-generating enzyme required for sulfatase activity
MELRKSAEVLGRDNEKPQRIVTVHSFEAQARPITNEEVMGFNPMVD